MFLFLSINPSYHKFNKGETMEDAMQLYQLAQPEISTFTLIESRGNRVL